MTRRLLAFSLPVLALFAVAARKPDHPKHENHYKPANQPKVEGLELTMTGAESQKQFIKLDAKMTNTTGDKLFIVRKDQAEFVLPTGAVKVKSALLFGGPLVIPPGESRSNVWNADGGEQFHVDTFGFNPKGFVSAPNAGTTVEAPDFQIAPSRNDFTAGPFSCNLKNTGTKTDVSGAEFECVYNGTGVGFIDARKIGARSKNGNEYANNYKNSKRDVLLPGDKAKFSTHIMIPASDADMQFVPYNLFFRDTFSESATTPLTIEEWRFELDLPKTADRNK